MEVSRFPVFVAVLVVLMVVIEVHVSEADNCDPKGLTPCALAAMMPLFKPKPSVLCCNRLKEQQSCFCGYEKNPNFSKFVSMEQAKRILTACDIPIPTC